MMVMVFPFSANTKTNDERYSVAKSSYGSGGYRGSSDRVGVSDGSSPGLVGGLNKNFSNRKERLKKKREERLKRLQNRSTNKARKIGSSNSKYNRLRGKVDSNRNAIQRRSDVLKNRKRGRHNIVQDDIAVPVISEEKKFHPPKITNTPTTRDEGSYSSPPPVIKSSPVPQESGGSKGGKHKNVIMDEMDNMVEAN